jgi:hypothetical protein
MSNSSILLYNNHFIPDVFSNNNCQCRRRDSAVTVELQRLVEKQQQLMLLKQKQQQQESDAADVSIVRVNQNDDVYYNEQEIFVATIVKDYYDRRLPMKKRKFEEKIVEQEKTKEKEKKKKQRRNYEIEPQVLITGGPKLKQTLYDHYKITNNGKHYGLIVNLSSWSTAPSGSIVWKVEPVVPTPKGMKYPEAEWFENEEHLRICQL